MSRVGNRRSPRKSGLGLVFLAGAMLACGQDGAPDAGAEGALSPFTDITEQVNLSFVHEAAVDSTYYMPESIGSGGGFLDYDDDGDLDIYLLNGAWRSPSGSGVSQPKNRLFRQDADGSFTDVTESSGLGDVGYGMGLAVGDIDNDGDVDVYVTNAGPDALYRNERNGTFREITDSAGVDNPAWGASAAFFDFDLDGFLDLYVTNYVANDPAHTCMDEAGRAEYCGPMAFPGVPDVLYRNRGDGTFEDVSVASGIATGRARGLGVVTADFDRDGWPDVYVANDSDPNRLWLNQRNATFRDAAPVLGAGVNALGRPEAGMGIAIGDLDADRDLDLFVTHLRRESNTLYRNTGKYGFQDETSRSRLHVPSLPYTGFGTGFLDFDHDGDLDITVVNGRVNRGPRLRETKGPSSWWDLYAEPNSLYENTGDGTFEDVGASVPALSEHVATSRGLAFGDVDNDGDIDLLVTSTGERARLLRNNNETGHWLIVKAVDPDLKRSAIGAEITLWMPGATRYAAVTSTYSFLSANDSRVHFGLGEAASVDSLRIRWPDGTETVHQVDVDRIVTISKDPQVTPE